MVNISNLFCVFIKFIVFKMKEGNMNRAFFSAILLTHQAKSVNSPWYH